MGGGFEGFANPSIPSSPSCPFGLTRKRVPTTLLSRTRGSITPRCGRIYPCHIVCCSRFAIGRSSVQRAFRIEDADSIMTHVPFIAARIASESSTPTAEEITEIVRIVRRGPRSQPFELTRARSKRKQVGGKIQTART